MAAITQKNQPSGVPALELTGERTLPDVPQENYWYQRHVVAYRWIADRCAGLKVADMACGEGYGSDILATKAAFVYGVDANPQAHEHARLRYRRANLAFRRELVEHFEEGAPYDAIVFLQTIEHLQGPEQVLERFKALLGPAGRVYVSTPNLLKLAPAGANKSDNPWHIREYRAAEFEELLRGAFQQVELFGIYHARKLKAHDLALRLGWDAVHKRLGISERFYNRFTPSIHDRDFHIAKGNLNRALDFLALCCL